MGLGVFGAAASTVIAEVLSGLLCLIYVYWRIPVLQVRKNDWRIDRDLLKQTMNYGSVTALQQATQPIGKLLIQGQMNSLGVDVMAVFNAVSKIDDFAFTPVQSIASGVTVFLAQNKGAKKINRLNKGFKSGLLLASIYWLCLCIFILCFKRPIMSLFVSQSQQNLIEMGAQYLTLMAFFYLWPVFTNGFQGYFRGVGKMRLTLVSTITQISFRVLFVYILVPQIGISGLAFASVIGWSIMLVYQVYCYRKIQKELVLD